MPTPWRAPTGQRTMDALSKLNDLPLRVAAVLRDGAVSLQLPARPRGALAGRHAQPPDRHPGLQRAGPAGLPPQRRLHLPPLLRPLPRLRAGAHAGGGIRSRTARSAARCATARGARRVAARTQVQPRALRALPALPAPATPAAAWTRTAASSTSISCCRAMSTTRPRRVPRGRRAAHGEHRRPAGGRAVVGLHVLRARMSRARASAPTTSCGRSSAAARSALPYLYLGYWIAREPQDGLQGHVPADGGPGRRGVAEAVVRRRDWRRCGRPRLPPRHPCRGSRRSIAAPPTSRR